MIARRISAGTRQQEQLPAIPLVWDLRIIVHMPCLARANTTHRESITKPSIAFASRDFICSIAPFTITPRTLARDRDAIPLQYGVAEI